MSALPTVSGHAGEAPYHECITETAEKVRGETRTSRKMLFALAVSPGTERE